MTKDEIKLRHPKTCNHCPAFMQSMSGSQCCTLGYKTERLSLDDSRTWRTTYEDLTVRIRPAEPCPKPKNISECVKIREVVDVFRYSNINSPEYKKEMEGARNMTDEESLIHYVNYNPNRFQYIITHYKDSKVTYIQEKENVISRTIMRSHAKIFESEKQAKLFLKSNGYKWSKRYSIEKL